MAAGCLGEELSGGGLWAGGLVGDGLWGGGLWGCALRGGAGAASGVTCMILASFSFYIGAAEEYSMVGLSSQGRTEFDGEASGKGSHDISP